MSFGWRGAISGMSADLARKQEFTKGPSSLRMPAPAALREDTDIFQVQFKRARCSFMLHPSAPRDVRVGDFVRVEADRGEDLGVVLTRVPARDFKEPLTTAGFRGRGFTAGIQGSSLHWITRLATAEELMQVESKVADEEEALRMAQDCVQVRRLPMTIIDAEYQFDRHKLVFYYEAARRVDFRELVADLFNTYRTRIWMQQVDTAWLSDDEPGLELARKSGFLVDAHECSSSSVTTSSSISMTGSAMSVGTSTQGGGGGGGGGGGCFMPQSNAPNNSNNNQWTPKLSSPQSRPLACSSTPWQELQSRRVVRAGPTDLSPSSSFSTVTRAGSNTSMANMDSASDTDDGGGCSLTNDVSLSSGFYGKGVEFRGSHFMQLQNLGYDQAEPKGFGGRARMQMQSDRGMGLGFNSSYDTTKYKSSNNGPPSGLQRTLSSSTASAPMLSLSSPLLSPSLEPLHTELSPCAPVFSPNHSPTHSISSTHSELVGSGALGLVLGFGFNQRGESEANLRSSGSVDSSNSGGSGGGGGGGGGGGEAAVSQALLRAPPGLAPLRRDRDSVLGPQAESVLESLGIDTDRSSVLATEPMLPGLFGKECPSPKAESPSRWHSPNQSHGKGCSRPWCEDNASLLRRSGEN